MIEEAGFAGSAGAHPLLTAPEEVSAAALAVLASSGASLSLAELQDAYLALQAASAQLEAAQLHLVRLLVEHERPFRRKAPGVQTKGWLERTARLGSGAASAEVAAARATDPTDGVLRGLGEALGRGKVSRRHVDVAARVLPRLPQAVLDARGAEVDEHLTRQAHDFSPSDTETLTRHLRRALVDDDAAGWSDPEPPGAAYERRQCSWYTDWTGMLQLRASLPPELAQQVTAALSGLAAPTREARKEPGTAQDDGVSTAPGRGPGSATGIDPGAPPDERTTTQRRADALTELVARALTASSGAELEVARLVVVATEDQMAGAPEAGGAACTHDADPLRTDVLHRYACDAVLDRVVLDRRGAVVSMESVGRLANRQQRRALAARDGGCAFPGCGTPASWCEAHHVVFWSQGGPTTVANLVLLCSRHHTEVHQLHWSITVLDDVPWFVPPPWVDPRQIPLRNSLQRRIAETPAVAARLRRPPPGAEEPAGPRAA